MGLASRFLFEESFDAKAREEEEQRVPAPEPETAPAPAATFTESELRAAREAAFAEGHAAGLAEGRDAAGADYRSSIERELAAVARRIAEDLAGIAETQNDLRQRFEADAIRVATTIARKAVPRLLQESAEDTVLAVVREVLPRVLDEPRIVVRVADPILDAVNASLERDKAASGFSGEFIVVADPDLGAADCLVEWADGGVDVSQRRLWRQIDSIISDFLTAERGTAATEDHPPGTSAADAPSSPVEETATADGDDRQP